MAIEADALKGLTAIEADALKGLTAIEADVPPLQTGKNKGQNVISQMPNASLRQIKRLQRKLFMTKGS
jgi:hypothetical protein